jgi:1A family penicillin-binding protein
VKKFKLKKLLARYSLDIKTIIVAVAALGMFVAGATLVWLASLPIPDLNSFEQRKVLQSTKLYDKTGEILLYDVNQDIRRTIVPFETISRNIKNAAVAIEDAEFYEHNGVKPKAIVRATLVNLFSFGYSQGGSTITQQVVKNSILTQEKLISRKLKEWFLALKLEKSISKERILEIYLNETPYGGSIYGVEEASRAFFGKSSSNITLAEAAYLAALPQAPTYFSPYGKNVDKLEQRKNLVLSRMLENDFITEEEYADARAEEVVFLERSLENIKAPHFVFFVLDILKDKYGERIIEERGYKIITSLDYSLQEKAEEIVQKHALENKTRFNAENGSLVAVDPRTGGIVVMVGSRGYFDDDIDGNYNIATAKRQPGSAFKPFVYAASFLKGYTPKTVVFDLSTEFSSACSTNSQPLYSGAVCYRPGNYDDKFRGPVTFEQALAQSLNIPAVKSLYLTGIDNAIDLAERMGIKTLVNKERYGLTLVLGGGEVSLLDMTSAYGVFANEGVRVEYQPVIRIEDSQGNIIEENKIDRKEVLPRQIALQISQILSSNELRAPAFGTSSFLHFPGRDVAVKTGTTNDYKDAWIVGYTPSLSVGSWAGNNNNTSMTKNVAGYIVAPMWNEFMQFALAKYPTEFFAAPDPDIDPNLKPVLRGIWQGGGSGQVIDVRTGQMATEDTPPEFRQEVFSSGVHNILHWVNKNNPRGPSPQNPASDPQYSLWEAPVRQWAQRQGVSSGFTNPPQQDQQTIDPTPNLITPLFLN